MNINEFTEAYSDTLDKYYSLELSHSIEKNRINEKVKQEMMTKKMAEQEKEKMDSILKEAGYEAKENISKIADDYKKSISKNYKIKGSELVEEDVNLLNSGIELSREEFTELLSKHKDNYTMERLIIEKAKEKDIPIGVSTLEDKLEAIDFSKRTAITGIEQPKSYHNARTSIPKHRAKLLEELKSTM